MNSKQLLIWLGTSAAAGAATGLIISHRQQATGSILGAGAGLLAGTVAAIIFSKLRAEEDDGVAYYSAASPYYEDFEDVKL